MFNMHFKTLFLFLGHEKSDQSYLV